MTWLEVIGLVTLWAAGGLVAFYGAFLATMRGQDHGALPAAFVIGAGALLVWTGLFWWVAT